MHSSMLQIKSQPRKASADNLSCYFIHFQGFVHLGSALGQGFEVVALSGYHSPLVSSVLPFSWHCWYCQSITWVGSEQKSGAEIRALPW